MTVSPRLHEDVEHVAVLVHRAPELLLATVERDEELVKMPRVTLLTASASVIQPDGMTDNLRRESIAVIAWCLAAHPPTVPRALST